MTSLIGSVVIRFLDRSFLLAVSRPICFFGYCLPFLSYMRFSDVNNGELLISAARGLFDRRQRYRLMMRW
jgi:hypothetical protein